MEKVEVWMLYKGLERKNLEREMLYIKDIGPEEVLAEPIYGCWEGNMGHALERQPIDICKERIEDKVVIGNSGVVRILKIGNTIKHLQEGMFCILFCGENTRNDKFPKKIYAYDQPNTMGLLSKKVKLHHKHLIPIPENSKYTLPQWAAFSLRYITAWSNWQVSYNCWLANIKKNKTTYSDAYVCAWGGGVSFAFVTLAKIYGFNAGLISSKKTMLKYITDTGLDPIDRNLFRDLAYNEELYNTDKDFKKNYRQAEKTFLNIIKEKTSEKGVAIFMDLVGFPVFRATLKALASPGVITTSGWKKGMHLTSSRAVECIKRHTHVHTHYASYEEGLDAVIFAETNGWLPPVTDRIWQWDDIPHLSKPGLYESLDTYFPIYQINPI
ncbi:hypothetical protein ACR71G_11860 [Xenorhabdus bovienii]|uniref:hypothetical protein n=1 Tax=Xenorhabdus bovienii TaxID=40576 RepID=UPI003DA5FAF9